MNNNFIFWQKWLTWVNIMVMGLAIIIAFAGNSFVFDLHNKFSADVFFEGQEMQGNLLNFKNWLWGIIGGTIFGFHALMVMISENAFKKKEKWAYQALWLGLLSWFVMDSSVSFYYGAIHNIIIINIVALILIGLPLVMTKKDFE